MLSQRELFEELNRISMAVAALNARLLTLLQQVDPRRFDQLGIDPAPTQAPVTLAEMKNL